MPSEPMNIQEQGFRSSLFGFDKNDVLAYMNALANEAQQHELEYNRQLQQMQSKLDDLRNERSAGDSRIESLKAELAAATQRADAAEAKRLAGLLAGKARWLKVGMTLYYAEGPSIVKAFKDLGFDVFLDLKFHDIPHQVEGAAASAVASGADMLTMHASGGVAMMQAAQRGVERVCAQTGRDLPATLGITVLTSMDEPTLKRIGVERAMEEQVGALALLAKESGISGVVASPQEARMLRDILGPDAYIVTPGVRPAGSAKGDQSRIATPADAFAAGASHIVVGRPITQAEDPAAAFDAIVSSL